MVKVLKDIYLNRNLIINMSRNDFKSRYSGSFLGSFWGVIQPLMTIFIFWFVFQIGFKAQPISEVPFILWLMCGMIPWNFFADSTINGTAAFTSYSYVVKKLLFRIEFLPLVKVISSFYLNIIFNLILVFIFSLYSYFPGFQIINIIYYNICIFVFVTALSYFTSTLNVFVKDTSQVIGIFLQFGIWLTPIMWHESIIPIEYRWIVKINPLYYIINGFRDSLINGIWFYEHMYQTAYFWCISLSLLFISMLFYKKMRTHFADVL